MVWSPYTKKNIEKVEEVQRRPTKFILTEDNYETRLKKLNLMSLKNRRILADVTFLYKALNGISTVISLLILTLIFILMLIIIHLGNMTIYLLKRNMQEQIHSNIGFFTG